jgi:small subunit ribosomal protein S21
VGAPLVDVARLSCLPRLSSADLLQLSRLSEVSRITAIVGAQRPFNIGTPVQVLVRDNNVDQALKALKKKMQREGIFREMKLRGHYEKPSEKRAREKAEAVRRARKLARKKLQREGLLPMKPKPAPGAPRTAG